MTRIPTTTFFAVLAALTACSDSSSQNPGKRPTGAPRMAKGQLPVAFATPAGMKKPKKVNAVRSKDGGTDSSNSAVVTALGAFSLVLEVGVHYTLVVELEDGSFVVIAAADKGGARTTSLSIGNPLDGDLTLDFGSVTLVDGFFVSTTVLLYMDWDGDGLSDFDDEDDDDDGIDDEDDDDLDNDGEDDDEDLDADGDGLIDFADDDDDNDGIDDDEDDDDDNDGIDDDEDDDDGDDDDDDEDDDDDDDDGDDGDDGDDDDEKDEKKKDE